MDTSIKKKPMEFSKFKGNTYKQNEDDCDFLD